MKKFFSFLLLMILFATTAIADTDTEIVFHGIPWGVNINKLVEKLQERKVPVSSRDIEPNSDLRYWDSQFLSITEDHFDSTGYRIMLYDYDDRIKIAGYPVLNIDAYAHYGIVDGEISLDADDSEYYLCTVMFSAGDDMVVKVYSDLLTKLTNLYGNCTENTTVSYSKEYTHAIWHGANNTAVMLYRNGSQYVCLVYGKTNSEETLRKVRQLVIDYQIQSVADDTTGL